MIKNKIFTSILFSCSIIGSLLILASATKTYGDAIPDRIAMQVIVGEAGDQGLKGMICVGEVLRQRGSIKGFRGFKSDRAKHQPRSAWKMAARAWKQSAHTNYTKGADHFANIRSFNAPSWVKHCVKTYEYKDHVFYKEIRRK